MAFELPNLPSFQTNIPQMSDTLQKTLEGAQLRNMLSEMALRQSLAPLQVEQAKQQIQASQTENEMKQMQLQGQRALTDWLQNGDADADVPAEKFSSNDKIATFVGVTPSDPIMNVIRSMAQHHVPAPVLVTEAQGMLQRRNEYYKGTKEEQDAQKNERLIWQEALASLHEAPEEQRSALLAAKLPLLQENSKTDPLLGRYAAGLAGHPELIDQAYNTLSAENQALGLRKGRAEAEKAQTEAITAGQKVINPETGMSPEQTAEGNKEIAVAKAEQPLKLQEATQKAKAEQLIQGMVKPGYAFDPATGETKLTDQTAYLQAGGKLQGFRPITEKEVKDDTMLINRLGDVHQKIAEYEQALQKPLGAKDQGNLAALLGTTGLKVGAFGTEIPMDRVNAALNKENLSKLSENARDQLIAFRNAREAMLGYKTVLSGSARGSDKSMDLLTQALPDPSITDPDFSKRSLVAFKQNLHIVGQGLPTLPGLKSPTQIESDVWGGHPNDPLKIR